MRKLLSKLAIPDPFHEISQVWSELRPGYYVQQCIFFSTISGPFSHN
jgi:hypothetical protein